MITFASKNEVLCHFDLACCSSYCSSSKIVKESKDGSFYLIVDGGNPITLNWLKAEQECRARGDHLASIHNANEATTVGSLYQASKQDRARETSFKKLKSPVC